MLDILSEIIEIVSTFTLNTINAWGSVGVFVLMALESANIPIPSEIIMPFSGFLASRGDFSFWGIILVGTLGQLAGSLVSYYVAAKLDTKIRKNRDFKTAERWFEKYGVWSVFLGRLLPIVRTFISFPAGMFKVNIWKFSILTFVGAYIWTWLLTYIGFQLGENWEVIGPYFRQFDYVIAGAGFIIFVWWLFHHFGKNKEL